MSELPSSESKTPAFDELVDRCTARFKRDRALRGELGQELASHLEASHAEYVASEFSEAAAHAAVLRDFGEAHEVAEGLWAANRRRLSWRFWGWWVARVALLPACVLLVAGMLMQGMIAGGVLSAGPNAVTQTPLGKWQEDRLKARLSDEQRMRYFGDDTQADPVDRWRAVRDRWPTEPRWQRKLIAELLDRDEASSFPNPARPTMDVPAFLEELERGRQIDPGNGVYDLLEASVVLNQSGWLSGIERESDKPEMFLAGGGRGAEHAKRGVWPYRWDQPPSDEAVDHAWKMLRRARQQPVVSMGSMALMRHQVEQLPPPRSLGQYMQRVGRVLQISYALFGNERVLVRAVVSEALRWAEAGRGVDASAMIDDLEAVVRKAAASRGTLVGVLVSAGEVATINQARVFVARAVGDDPRADTAIAVADAALLRYRELMGAAGEVSGSQDLEKAGFLMSLMVPGVPGFEVDFEPFRLAEYVLMDRWAMTLVVGVLTGLAAVGSLVGLLMMGRGTAPMLVWIGWRRLARVVGVSVVLPTLVFAVWSRSPWGGRGLGIDQRPWLLLGWAFAAGAVGWLALVMGLQALRQRAIEVGLAVPPSRGRGVRWARGLAKGVAVAGASGFFVWAVMNDLESLGDAQTKAVFWYAAVVLLVGVVWWVVACWIVCMGGVARSSVVLGRAAIRSAGLGAVLITVVWIPTLMGYAGSDGSLFRRSAVAVLLPVSGLVGLMWLWRRPGRPNDFARSAVRSLTPVLAACALAGGVLWGPLVSWREASLARRLVEVSPVFVDLEVERSNAKAVRAWLADPTTPR